MIRRLVTHGLGFLGSLTGRIVILLTIGMSVAAFSALLIAEGAQIHIFERLRLENVVASAADISARLEHDPETVGRMLRDDAILGARLPPDGVRLTAPDGNLTALLRRRFGNSPDGAGQAQPSTACFPSRRYRIGDSAAGLIASATPTCWLVTFRNRDNRLYAVEIGLPHFVIPPRATLDPLYLTLVLLASALLAIVTGRLASAPLRRLTRAARAFSLSADPEPIPETGPREVRTAIATFNLMQRRLSEGLRERTHILAAISHDLQTPLTRLRLRLEQVQDDPLRERLVADLAATQKLVREGLDLARSSDNREEWQVVDIDSLLASLAEDAAEFGANVVFAGGCGESLRTKPDALSRCLTNLIDNAVNYGGGCELRCIRDGRSMEISVADRGPGLPGDALETMFEPFVRGERSRSRATGGTGIGLTIARAQAQLFGGEVTLRNRQGGGLTARIRMPAAP